MTDIIKKEDLVIMAGRLEANTTALGIAASCYPSYTKEGIQIIEQLSQLARQVRDDVSMLDLSKIVVNELQENLLFFAYGLFKPGQLAYKQIAELVVDYEPMATVKGVFYERDGLPLLKTDAYNTVKGALLTFHTGQAQEAYKRINSIEPESQYSWVDIEVSIPNGVVKARVLLGVSPNKGSVRPDYDSWDGKTDPLFTTALEVIEQLVHENKDFMWDLKNLFRLEMGYLLLWSAIERFVSFRYPLQSSEIDPKRRSIERQVEMISKEPSFKSALKEVVKEESRNIFRADQNFASRVRTIKLNPDNPLMSIRYYYQLRCNIAHRGKGLPHDHERLISSLEELIYIFREVLDESFQSP